MSLLHVLPMLLSTNRTSSFFLPVIATTKSPSLCEAWARDASSGSSSRSRGDTTDAEQPVPPLRGKGERVQENPG